MTNNLLSKKLVLASGNQGKLRELNSLLQDAGIEVVPQSDFDIPDAIEDGLSFVENAIIKARHASRLSGLPAIADDSGLEVDALHGKPGIYSARFAADQHHTLPADKANNLKLLQQMEGLHQADRGARFRCVLVLMRHHEDPCPVIAQGTWEGRILHQEEGEEGFGYDPLFYVADHDCSAAQLSKEEKSAISHRGQALKQLLSLIESDVI